MNNVTLNAFWLARKNSRVTHIVEEDNAVLVRKTTSSVLFHSTT